METLFSELKAGDEFKYDGYMYEKISGNFADDLLTGKPVEFSGNEKVIVTRIN